MRAWWLAGPMTVVLLATSACGGDSPRTAQPAASPTTAGPSVGARIQVAGLAANYHGTEDIRSLHDVTIELADDYFSPTVLRGRPGQKIVLTLKNTSTSPHHFTTADQQFIVEVQPGLTAEGRVTLPPAGNLSFFCLLARKAGMAGAFNVSGPLDAPDPHVSPETGGPRTQPGPETRPSPAASAGADISPTGQ